MAGVTRDDEDLAVGHVVHISVPELASWQYTWLSQCFCVWMCMRIFAENCLASWHMFRSGFHQIHDVKDVVQMLAPTVSLFIHVFSFILY